MTIYVKYISETEIEYAPSVLITDKGKNICPTDAEYRQAGYKPFEQGEEPIIEFDYCYIETTYEDTPESVKCIYTIKEDLDKKRTYLVNYCYLAKVGKAYGGIIINDTYLFETNELAISNLSATFIALQNAPDSTVVNWKVYANNIPTIIPITKAQLSTLFAFGMNMVNTSFGVEGIALDNLSRATDEELKSDMWVVAFKANVQNQMDAINNKIYINIVEES